MYEYNVEEMVYGILDIVESTLAERMSVEIGDGVYQTLFDKITRALESDLA